MRLYWTILTTIWIKEINRFTRIWIQTLLPSVINTSLYFLIFGNLIGSRLEDLKDNVSYTQFIAPGLIMMSIVINSYSNVASSFFNAKFQKSIEEMLVAPISSHILICGYIGGGIIRGLLVGLLVTIVSLIFVNLTINSLLFLLLVIIMTATLFSLAGMLNALFANRFDDISVVPTFILTPLTYLSGIFYPVELLSNFWRQISYLNPMVYIMSIFRFVFLGFTTIPLTKTFIISGCLILGFYLLCWYIIENKSYLRG